jgi:hypothetical protein
MSSLTTTIAAKQHNVDVEQVELVNTDSTLPRHKVQRPASPHISSNAHPANNNDNPTIVPRAMTFPPRHADQTLCAYVGTNFKVITIIVAVAALVVAVLGVIAAIVVPIVRK